MFDLPRLLLFCERKVAFVIEQDALALLSGERGAKELMALSYVLCVERLFMTFFVFNTGAAAG